MKHNSIVNLITFGKMFGLKGLFCFYFKKWTLYKLPVSLPVFGTILREEELLSIRDNILKGSIRDMDMERRIRTARKPVIVDCGVNMGVTARWWFHLNPQAVVYGIDMMREANDFTINSLADRFKARYVPITTVLSSGTGRVVELSYDDPLFGGNNAGAASGDSEKRQVRSMTLDDCLRGYRIDTIELLKVDIEDSAALMFQGASETLPKVKDIILEVHSERERSNAIRILSENGFYARRSYKRHIWLDRQLKKLVK